MRYFRLHKIVGWDTSTTTLNENTAVNGFRGNMEQSLRNTIQNAHGL